MEKEKKPFQSQLSIAREQGIMLKLEAIKTTLSLQGQRRVLLMYFIISENEIIHILMYFIATHQVGLVQESANYSNATKKGRTSNTICSNT